MSPAPHKTGAEASPGHLMRLKMNDHSRSESRFGTQRAEIGKRGVSFRSPGPECRAARAKLWSRQCNRNLTHQRAYHGPRRTTLCRNIVPSNHYDAPSKRVGVAISTGGRHRRSEVKDRRLPGWSSSAKRPGMTRTKEAGRSSGPRGSYLTRRSMRPESSGPTSLLRMWSSTSNGNRVASVACMLNPTLRRSLLAGCGSTLSSNWSGRGSSSAWARPQPRRLLGRDFRITQRRGEVIRGPLGNVVATYHPSAVLRAPDTDARQQMKRSLIDDLRVAARLNGHNTHYERP